MTANMRRYQTSVIWDGDTGQAYTACQSLCFIASSCSVPIRHAAKVRRT